MGGKFINIASFGKLLFFKPEKAENRYRNRKKGKRGEREVDIIQWMLGCKKKYHNYVFLINTIESLVSDTHYEQCT